MFNTILSIVKSENLINTNYRIIQYDIYVRFINLNNLLN